MTIVLVLEDFDSPPSKRENEGEMVAAQDQESDRLSAFEKGYKAGWDDSSSALSAENQRLSVDFATNLTDLSFTYHEARTHILKGFESLLKQSTEKLLPQIAKAALPQLIWEQIEHLAETSASRPLTLLVSPEARADVESILPKDTSIPIEVREEQTLAEGQVYLRSGVTEVGIDTSAVLSKIEVAVNEFFQTQTEENKAHG
ncbi:flagellar biosynthesis protein [Meridianimarinicoccus aquatilis]|uniref:Flagellar biosynthesis protein n=1 Tax=Meridianimarinicoccus aquatilis TaxID=2552766 RepID=A0A4R6AXD2_9RHOB|nr:flagellar biosynthesis protein [Fluviibacterium aquatile]TDL87006.1 flagellar biosynthesis protein [Fluviibacterium aquatile]